MDSEVAKNCTFFLSSSNLQDPCISFGENDIGNINFLQMEMLNFRLSNQ